MVPKTMATRTSQYVDRIQLSTKQKQRLHFTLSGPYQHRELKDNDPKHSSKSASRCLKKKKIGVLRMSSQSPDRNLIELLRQDFNRRTVHISMPKNILKKLNNTVK